MCLWKHDYKNPLEVRRGIRLLECKRCKNRYVMNDHHELFLRYDNDKAFSDDLMRIYPEITPLFLTGGAK